MENDGRSVDDPPFRFTAISKISYTEPGVPVRPAGVGSGHASSGVGWAVSAAKGEAVKPGPRSRASRESAAPSVGAGSANPSWSKSHRHRQPEPEPPTTGPPRC